MGDKSVVRVRWHGLFVRSARGEAAHKMSVLSIKFSQDQDRFLREFVQSSFVEQVFTDCTLYCWAEDRAGSNQAGQRKYCTFKCHRLVLSAYSDFFRQCFLEAAKGSSMPSLFLDIEPRTLENILRLIYFGHIEIVQSDIELFFNAATKLSLKDFKIANSNDVFNVDVDLNHLKRRLTQEESSLSKSSRHSRSADKSNHDFSSAKDRNQSLKSEPNEGANEQMPSHREETLLARVHSPSDKAHGDTPLVSSSMSRLSGTTTGPSPGTESSPSADGTNAFSCTICNKQYSYKISLNKHIKSAHSN